MGGYSSFPVCIAASILRIKFIIYENNLVIGKANKFLLPFAEKIFVSYKELEGISEKYNHKILQIGNIVRENIINSNFKDNQTNSLNEMRILILGGSQAAKSFAEELPIIFDKLRNSKVPLKIYQQCQENQNEQLSHFYKEAKIDFELFNFTDDILNYYSKANLVITRAGASVLGELINCKVPFISIPLPSSADNHQYKNAIFYKNQGYGYFLEEREIKNKLYNMINSFFIDKSLIKNILVKQQQYSDKNVFKNINDYIKKILNGKN
jgi:UDP-N-acetylglucosamine--N-acetylmuramyl-(pentapeptide) pyrophosphoryl-undecaprenol N-acetylglucosamine transferase